MKCRCREVQDQSQLRLKFSVKTFYSLWCLYFIKFILWEIASNQGLTITAHLQQVGEGVPPLFYTSENVGQTTHPCKTSVEAGSFRNMMMMLPFGAGRNLDNFIGWGHIWRIPRGCSDLERTVLQWIFESRIQPKVVVCITYDFSKKFLSAFMLWQLNDYFSLDQPAPYHPPPPSLRPPSPPFQVSPSHVRSCQLWEIVLPIFFSFLPRTFPAASSSCFCVCFFPAISFFLFWEFCFVFFSLSSY